MRLFGESDWAARLPVALFAFLMAGLLYRFGTRFWDRKTGFFSALIYLSSLGPYSFTRILLPDVMLTFFVALALYAYLQVLQFPEAGRRLLGRWDARALLIYVASAFAVLTKGLVGMVFVGGVILVHLILSGRWEVLRRVHLIAGSAAFLLVAAPWHIAAGLDNPGFFWFYFVNEHFLRFLGMRYPKDYDTVPLALFWGLQLVWIFPWTAFVLGLARDFPRKLRSGTRTEQVNLFLYVWVFFVLVFFSFSTTQEYYSFPILPALALLVGQVLARLQSRKEPALSRKALWGVTALAVLGLSAGGGLLWLRWVGAAAGKSQDLAGTLTWNPGRYALFFGHFYDLTPATFASLSPLVIGAAFFLIAGPSIAFLFAWRRRWLGSFLSLAVMMAGLLHYYNAGMVAFQPILSSRGLATAMQRGFRDGDLFVINGEYESGSSVSYYSRHQAHILNGRSANLWYGSFYDHAPPIFYDDLGFLRVWRSGKRVFLFSEEEPFQ